MIYYAHTDNDGNPKYLLRPHIVDVACGAAREAWDHPFRDTLYGPAVLAGFAHDLGKYTSFFQQRLQPNFRLSKGPDQYLYYHAQISALWAIHLASLCSSAFSGQKPGLPEALTYLAVLRHHQNLDDPEDDVIHEEDMRPGSLHPEVRWKVERVERQVQDIQTRKDEIACDLSLVAEEISGILQRSGLPPAPFASLDMGAALESFLRDWKGLFARYKKARPALLDKADPMRAYFLVVSMVSCLVNADRMDAARVGDVGRKSPPADAVESHKRHHFKKPARGINVLRERLYQEVLQRAKCAPLEQRIFTVTAPTGFGKTLAALNAALVLRDKVQRAQGYSPRIVYSLPFTSVIEQVHGKIREVLSDAGLKVPSGQSPYLVKHHHLADVSYESDVGKRYDLGQAALLVEGWEGDIVVTTFVQVLETLIGNRLKMARKFNRLAKSVIILDEVQNVPMEYWGIVSEALRSLAKELDTRIILMTATRPEWFRNDEALELAGDPKTIEAAFSSQNRVRISADKNRMTVEDAALEFVREYRANRLGKTSLVVLNTIASSIEFFNAIKGPLEADGVSVFYLSTNIIPHERQNRLCKIAKAMDKRSQRLVLVSTQVVEAGVDLDFDSVWRDLAPVDSVVQAAGRCNRSGRRKQGIVRVLRLADKRGLLGRPVYGSNSMRLAERLFTTRSEMEERDFKQAVEDYFEDAQSLTADSKSKTYWDAIRGLHFAGRRDSMVDDTGIGDFRLIDDNKVSVYVEVPGTNARELWDEYQIKVVDEKNLAKKREEYLRLKAALAGYIVSISYFKARALGFEETGLKPIPESEARIAYNRDTGLNPAALGTEFLYCGT